MHTNPEITATELTQEEVKPVLLKQGDFEWVEIVDTDTETFAGFDPTEEQIAEAALGAEQLSSDNQIQQLARLALIATNTRSYHNNLANEAEDLLGAVLFPGKELKTIRKQFFFGGPKEWRRVHRYTNPENI